MVQLTKSVSKFVPKKFYVINGWCQCLKILITGAQDKQACW